MTTFFGILTLGLYMFQPYLDLKVMRKALGIALFLELFYLIGHFLAGWPFPTPTVIFQIIIVTALGVALGVIFSRIWPLPRNKGFERIMRTFLIVIPSLGIGVGLQLVLQGNHPTQAIYLMFAFSAWLGSGHFIKNESKETRSGVGNTALK
ncbi:hypothetical protein [Pseudalkalibacillus salsuginis]|uniref:hypothetical protein n=1 Tax=Pseudalkalibacillus salsuginis TaxID=2910972 RepID=UPI001F2261BB|nr:hypothetical protein [Pseudalkalibacillus salsuginis]MCF6411705.1 hypothetical protein [Pseudalkalibacillus salsuginis]